MTVTQVGKALDIAPAKVHYHVRELERVGLVRQVFTREKSGILEKYYRAVARDISVPRSLVTSAPRDELLAAANEFAQSAVSGYLRALGRLVPLPDEEFQRYPFSISNATLWLTKDELINSPPTCRRYWKNTRPVAASRASRRRPSSRCSIRRNSRPSLKRRSLALKRSG